jgi:hypothetical protein
MYQSKQNHMLNTNIIKAGTIALVIMICSIASFARAEDEASKHMGTWKLNEAKSKLAPGMPKNNTVIYEAAGDQVKVTVDGTDKDGKSTHSEWTGKFDGKDYPVTGDPTSDARSYKKVDDTTLKLTNKKDGKVTVHGKIVVSADGKTRTVTLNGTDPKGNKVKGTAAYDKE